MAEIIVNLDQTRKKAVGSPVHGSMVMKLGKTQEISKIQLRIVGQMTTRDHQSSKKSECEEEKFLEIWLSLFSSDTDSNLTRIFEPGAYKYPFKFVLPEDAPGSFAASKPSVCLPNAEISYFMEAIVCFSDKQTSSKFSDFLTFESLDLKQFPEWVPEPSTILPKATHLATNCCGKGQGTINCTIVLYKLYFVAGGPIPITVNLSNEESSTTIGSVAILLKQTVTYSVENNMRLFEISVAKTSINQTVPPGGTKILNSSLKVPEEIGASTPEKSDRKIRLKYQICVQVSTREGILGRKKKYLVNSQDVVISTLPFKK